MTLMRIDLLDWEATQFELDLIEVIVPIHEAAVTSLQAIHYDGEGVAQEQIREADAAADEGESQLARDMANEEEKRARERERVIGWLVLLHMGIVLELKLRKLYDLLEKIFSKEGRRATAVGGNRGTRSEKNWLRKLSDKYRRYGVQLESHPKFNFIDELVFACNAVKHNSGKLGESYLKAFPKPRFVQSKDEGPEPKYVHRKDEHIVFSIRDFRDSVESLREFVEWVVREIKHRRDGQKPVGPLQQPRPRLRA